MARRIPSTAPTSGTSLRNIHQRRFAVTSTGHNSPASTLILSVGAISVLCYAIATSGEVLSGSTGLALGWGVKLMLGLGASVVAAAWANRRADRDA